MQSMQNGLTHFSSEEVTSAMDKMKIGIVGCGNIVGAYMSASKQFDILEIVACADIDMARAKAKAKEFDIPKACTVDDLLADPDIEIVVNLTIPHAHAEIAIATLEAGKHAYSEKPFAVTREQGQAIIALAAEKGLRIGCAPDTFLGAGLQTCRKLIDDGWIGEPVAAAAYMLGHGPEAWHPNPDFFYQPGAGPLFDMGPYYLTALTSLLGPVNRLSASAKITFPERRITSEPHYDENILVNTPTHVTAILEYASGVTATLTTSFDVWGANHPPIEIYGTEGSLAVPDPNTFRGPVCVRRAGADEWSEMPLSHSYADQSRSVGVADMAHAIRSGRPHRASGELGFHVLDIMETCYQASDEQKFVKLGSTCERPAAFPVGMPLGILDD